MDMYACEVRAEKLPPTVLVTPIRRLSLDGEWGLIRCSVLHARTTPEQRQGLLDDGYMVELTESEWLVKSESAQYKDPEEVA